MIKFTLSCDNDHRFESWFASSDAFEGLKSAGHLACAICGSTEVEKSLMAPSVATREVSSPQPSDMPTQQTLTSDPSPQETALAELRRKVEENADYVGMSFAKEARAIHDGTSPDRPIYGEANLKEAKSLIEDGVPVAPLPFLPKRKAN